MIRKLKTKFILTNMLLISIVLIATFCFIYFSTANNLETDSITAMKEISASTSSSINKYFYGDAFAYDDKYSYLKTFTIETNDINMTYTINGYEVNAKDINDEQKKYLNELIRTIYDTKKAEGIITKFNLRYYSVDTLLGKRMVFLDKEYEDTTLNQLVLNFTIVGIGALTAFLFISVIISRIAVAPVEKSLKQQMQLVADASHELKTPITVISANTDILLANKDSTIDEQKKWVEYIKTESSRMTALVNNMLYLAKTDENKKEEMKSIINLSDTVNGCILPFESICFEKNKSLDTTIVPNIYIKGNESLIKQLIVILIDNAFKYSDENGRIKVAVSEEQDKAVISVWNSGNLIPPDQLKHIFERFYRVDKSRSRTEGGYGLGLSIAASIIDSHNAKITVNSTSQTGTMFRCIFKSHK